MRCEVRYVATCHIETASEPRTRRRQFLPCRCPRRAWTLSRRLSAHRAEMGRSAYRHRHVGRRAFTARIGRNETFNHAGNAVAAAIAGSAAYLFGPQVVFYLLALMSMA